MEKVGRGLRFKLAVTILSSVGLLFIGLFSYNYVYSRDLIKELIRKDAMDLAVATAKKIEIILRGVEKITENASLEIADNDSPFAVLEMQSKDVVRRMLKTNEEIYGSTIALEPSLYGGDKFSSKFAAPYWYKGEKGLRFRYLTYDYTVSDWYLIPKELGKPDWSEPYFDVGGGDCLMTTYSVPIYKNIQGEKVFAGVITADVSLEWLRKIVSSLKAGKSGYAFIVSRNGTFIAHPDENLVMNESIFSVAAETRDETLRDLGKRMIHGEEGYGSIKDWSTGSDCWLVFRPLAMTGWSVGIILPKSELLEDVTKLNHMVAFIGGVGLLLLLGVVLLIAESITKPIRAFSRSAERIAQGDLDAPVPIVSSRDEIAVLAASFSHMQTSLKYYIEELSRTVAERQRIESELTIAREIQMGILPKSFPPFPDRQDFDIYARLQPAREVGGDFYDFFFTDSHHFWVVIGDVSGKGVPASLFMAITRTLIKAKANGMFSPGTILEQVNRDLSADNPSVMFVTLFIGMLDTRTGLFTYANGGHNPPYLVKRGEKPQRLPATKGMALGVYEALSYRENSCRLNSGDVLFLYTDGVTEALNVDGEFFSSERLERSLETTKNLSPREVVECILKEVEVFSDGVPQADDITVLVLRLQRIRDDDAP